MGVHLIKVCGEIASAAVVEHWHTPRYDGTVAHRATPAAAEIAYPPPSFWILIPTVYRADNWWNSRDCDLPTLPRWRELTGRLILSENCGVYIFSNGKIRPTAAESSQVKSLNETGTAPCRTAAVVWSSTNVAADLLIIKINFLDWSRGLGELPSVSRLSRSKDHVQTAEFGWLRNVSRLWIIDLPPFHRGWEVN